MIGGYIGRPIGGVIDVGGDVTLTASLFTNTNTFYSPTVAASYTLEPGLFADGDTFYSPTVAASYDLIPALYSDDDTFYSATVTASYELTPALFVDADTFYTPVVTTAYDLFAPHYSDADTFYEHGAVRIIEPAHFANSNVFYPAQIRFFGGGTGLVFPTGKQLAALRRLQALADAQWEAKEAEKRRWREALRAEIEKQFLVNIGAWVEPWEWPDIPHPATDLAALAFEIGGKDLRDKFDSVLLQMMEAERQAMLDMQERDLEILMMMAA